MEITGKVVLILPQQGGTSKTGKEWKKQEFVIETQENYPKNICIGMWGDKIIPLEVGELITASINIESREYNGYWYTNVTAWRISIDAPAEFSRDVVPQPQPQGMYAGDEMPF